MNNSVLFKKYVWLIHTISRSRKITFKELNSKWLATDMSEGEPLSRTTFNRHKEAIAEIFGIWIGCDRRDESKYYIENQDDLKENSLQNWMLSTLSVNNMLSESSGIHDRILLESVPSNGEYLYQVIEAMKQNLAIEIRYKKYTSDIDKIYFLELYCVKLCHRRWYVLGHFPQDNQYKTLAFDRIISLTISDKKFKMDSSFDASQFFAHCFGIVGRGDYSVQKIKLRAYGTERYYIKNLPLHSSQKEIQNTDEYTDFEYE